MPIHTYLINQQVTGTVCQVLPYGVFVRLHEGSIGYIRRRELGLEADADPEKIVRVDDRIHAVVIALEEAGKHIELSRKRTLTDPWAAFLRRQREGDVLQGTVQALHPKGVFVRIQPGISGFVPLADLATWRVAKPEDLLWVGDAVEVVITRLDGVRRKLMLSIKARMEQRARAYEQLERIAEHSMLEAQAPAIEHEESEDISAALDQETAKSIGSILVVDDDATIRTLLTRWLREKGLEAFEAGSISSALEQIQMREHRILLLDLNLEEEDGLEITRKAQMDANDVFICLMSSFDALSSRAQEIEAAHLAHVFAKPLDLDEIEQFLLEVAHGKPPSRTLALLKPAARDQELEIFQQSQEPPRAALHSALKHVTEFLRAECGLIFWQDPFGRAILILAQAGNSILDSGAMYGLTASPVKSVIANGDIVFESHASARSNAKFNKLLALLEFESCLGVPIIVNDEIQHAAFFFHREAEFFSRYRLRDAGAAALLFAALLTRASMEKHLRALNPLLLSGELAAGFGHDVLNKITGLELEARKLANSHASNPTAQARQVLELVADLKQTVHVFEQLRQPNGQRTTFAINLVVEQATRLLLPIARKEQARFTLRLAPDLPLAVGNPAALQQVLVNIMLNSVQQMKMKAEKFKWNGRRIFEISTCIDTNQIQIQISDAGPGIHHDHLEKIFRPGFSTRGGSGMGLYIAQNFVHMLGGTLVVEETLIPHGTTFCVQLPMAEQEKQK